jgi:quercetin 2,3-dioxygenase
MYSQARSNTVTVYKGKMTAGDVQWMTAGSGILHQEMPKGDKQGRMHGFQLWANLPASLKMTDPRYQDIPASAIPEVTDDDGTRVRIICGEFWGKRGPVEGVAADPNYLDISVAPGQRKHLKIETARSAFAYVFGGAGTFRDASDPRAVLTEHAADANSPAKYDVSNHSLVLFDRGDEIVSIRR